LMKSSASERGDLSDRVGRRKNNVQVAAREHPSEEEDYAVSASSGLPADCDHQPNGTERPTTEELYQAHSQEGHEGSSSATAIEMTSLKSHGNGKSGVEQPGKGNNPYFYHIGATGYFRRLWELGRNKRCRRALLSASGIRRKHDCFPWNDSMGELAKHHHQYGCGSDHRSVLWRRLLSWRPTRVLAL
jgi:hypothetical protein